MITSASPSSARAARVRLRAVALLLDQLKTSLSVSSLVAILFSFGLRESISARALGGWLVGFGVITGWRWWGRHQFLSQPQTRLARVEHWYRLTHLGAALGGGWWGVGFAMGASGSSSARVLSIVICAGIVAGSLGSSLGSRAAMRLFSLPALAGLMFSLASYAENETDWLLLLALGLYTITLQRTSSEVTERVLQNFELLEAQQATVEELQATRDTAVSAVRARTDFLSVMSHEIRTPLNGVVGMTALLRDTQLDVEQRDYLDTIQFSAEALTTLVDGILDLSKIDAGRLQLDPADVALADELARLVRLFRPRADERQLALVLTFDPHLPARVHLDWPRLRQICVNLLGNALKFTERGSVTCRVGLREGRLCIEVADTGIGMSSQARQALFQPFVQADLSIHRRFGGTGLGLSIARRLARLMGGDIEVTSAPGEGSCFTVQVPLVEALAPAQVAAPLLRTGAGLPARVLVADDNEINLRIVSKILERAGHRVVTASDGPGALARLLGGEFDLALIDVQMPGMSGLEVVNAARVHGVKTPLLALTASASVDDRRACAEAGYDEFLTKPIAAAALLDSIERWRGRPAAA